MQSLKQMEQTMAFYICSGSIVVLMQTNAADETTVISLIS